MIIGQPFGSKVIFQSIVLFFLFLIAFFTFPRSSSGFDFIDFYPVAEARTQSPPDLTTLSIVCREKKFWGPHITFVGNPDKKIILVTFTDKRVENLDRVITLIPKFFTATKEELYSPTARIGPDATLDWTYVYDRNGDGRVDYIAYLYAVLPVKPDDFPEDFPKGNKFKATKERLHLLYNNTRMIFSHHADENFDGASDAVVASIFDPDREFWVEQFGVLQSTKLDGHVNKTWTFKRNISQQIDIVRQVDGQYILQNGPGIKLQTGDEWFAFGTRVIGIINEYAKKCSLTKESFLQK